MKVTQDMKRAMIWPVAGVILLVLVWAIRERHGDGNTLPVYNPADLNPELVDLGVRDLGEGHKVADFRLVNQNGDTISQEEFAGKIYVVDFFFTRCPTICPVMGRNMHKLQEEYKSNDRVMLLSISVTPEYDSVPVIRQYALQNGAILPKWNITTGDKKHIYELARKSYFAVTDQGDGGLQDFIHTPNFVLVDTERQIRGIYDGTEDSDISRLKGDINLLQD
jgi:protein SCO1/2